MSAIGLKYSAEVGGIKSVTAAKQQLLDLDNSLTVRQKAYGDIFKKTFESMGDAIADFTKTGKLDFKSLIDSMLQDLLRYELRMQALALYQAARPGLLNGFGLFGGSSGAGFDPTGGAGASAAGYGTMGAYAKGNIFDAGLQRFAMGGAFTNQIVSSPTLFKFAQGTGMMGEAGPEAIIPLKRDGSGNLGVRANNQNVEVVVNNYGSETATTQETTDSRGNRRIEVTIGDLNAAQLASSGSSSQKAIKNTYGLQPQLIRR
jgi:lambda family phage tail tape measure protein